MVDRMAANTAAIPNATFAGPAGESKRTRSDANVRFVQEVGTPMGPPIRIHSLGRFVVSGLHNVGLGEAEGRTHARAVLAIAAATATSPAS